MMGLGVFVFCSLELMSNAIVRIEEDVMLDLVLISWVGGGGFF
jgi:hypothetical protein